MEWYVPILLSKGAFKGQAISEPGAALKLTKSPTDRERFYHAPVTHVRAPVGLQLCVVQEKITILVFFDLISYIVLSF